MARRPDLNDDGGLPPDPSDLEAYFAWHARQQEKRNAQMMAAAPGSSGAAAPSSAPIRIGANIERLAALNGITGTPAGDRTARNVAAQIEAWRKIGVDRFEVQAIPPKGSELKPGRIHLWTADQVQQAKNLAYLRAQNAQGRDIYVRPAPIAAGMKAATAFMDDMNAATVKKAQDDGIRFLNLIESSSGNFHGWALLSKEPITEAELTAAGRELALRYGTDPAAIDHRRFGRLSGFTNRKPSRAIPGKGQPFALMRSSSDEVSPLGSEILAIIRAHATEAERHAKAKRREMQERQRVQAFSGDRGKMKSAAQAFQEARSHYKGPHQGNASAEDFFAAMALLGAGYSGDQVKAALLETRPDLADKHDVEDYLRRTVEGAQERVSGQTTGYRPRR